jgi:predicted transglutaminase-like cysteine proteinase
MPWREVGRHASSPQDVCAHVKAHVRYRADMFAHEEWQAATRTWQIGTGDCEDYAVCVRDLARQAGFQADIYVLRSKTARASHAVVIGTYRGSIWASSNGSYRVFQSVDDAKQALAAEMGWYSLNVQIKKV